MVQGSYYINAADKGRYAIAIYIRLSCEDRDLDLHGSKKESNSITNQRNMLLEFIRTAKEFEGCEIIEKCDDGFSGVNFDNRPQFVELIELAKKGEINCIIVKDFSRFGRNYIELGDYLEQLFPFLGVRFISVNDGYDSEKVQGGTGGLDVAFKNLIYDFYSRENSKKQKIAWRRMAEKGEYNAHCALYGYKKDKADKHKLVIHEETGKVVKSIFDMMIAGMSTMQIAKLLNEKGINCPSEFHKENAYMKNWNRYGSRCYWTNERINYIICDERYTGTMVSLKTELITVKGKMVKKPSDQWIRVEGTHEAIVPYEIYIKAKSLLRYQESHGYKKAGINIYHCGYCGRKMQTYGRKNYLVCPQRRYIEKHECLDVKINDKEEMDRAVLVLLKQQIRLFLEEDNISEQAKKRMSVMPEADEIKTVARTISSMQARWLVLYEKYADGQMEREEFIAKKKQHDADISQLEDHLKELQVKQKRQQGKRQEAKEKYYQSLAFMEQEDLTEEMKEKLIDKVLVYPDNRIEIHWAFESSFDSAQVENAACVNH